MITVCKYDDLNANGSLNEGEPSLAGVTITLGESRGLTGENGCIVFDGLTAGSYQVGEIVPEGYYQTSPIDPDYFTQEVVSGTDATFTFLNARLATLGDFIWEDANADGIQDPSEPGITGVVVNLYLDNGDGVFDPGTDTLVDTQTSDGLGGSYEFTGLIAGNYWVDVQESTAPSGFALTTGNDPLLVTINPGDNFMDADFGFVPPSREISITKSNDKSSGASLGEQVTYTLTVTNNGNVDLSNVVIKDVLPGGFTYVLGSTTGDTSSDPIISGNNLSWNVGDLAQGASKTLTYKAQISTELSNGLYTNYATCSSLYGREETVECNTASSNVNIGGGQGYGGNLSGQVLGASTILPATGSPAATGHAGTAGPATERVCASATEGSRGPNAKGRKN